MKIVERSIGDLKPYPQNAKKHDQKQIDNVANSIRRFGWRQPIVIDRDDVVVIGHCRLLAAKQLGLETGPVTVADDLTPDEIRELRIADNKTNESPWDSDTLQLDAEGLKFEGFDFEGLTEFAEESGTGDSWFDRDVKDGAARQDGNDEYNEFLEKFEAKKTTDDCYTPDNVYEAVANWVSNRYGVDRSKFIRPFYPGGDYQSAKYPKDCAVVDNPPFSIMSEIVRFYMDKGIRFFLFAPSLTCFNYIAREGATVVGVFASITYENKASIRTSFLTNMDDPEIAAFSDVELFRELEKANEENEKTMHANLPKYEYPDEVLTAAKMGWLCRYGQALIVRRDESLLIRGLDAMKEQDKAIYGNGLLLSESKTAERAAAERAAAERAAAERAAAERAAAERAAATKWKLSDRERELQRNLGKQGE